MSDSKMDLLSQMLVKAEDKGATPEERDTFLRAVSKMAAKAGIELDMLRAKANEEQGKKVNSPISKTVDIGTKGDRGGGAYAALFVNICQVYDIEVIISNSGSWVKTFGMASDIEIAKKLYDMLFPQMVADCIDYIGDNEWRSEGVTIYDARYSFYSGWRTRIQQRLRSDRIAEIKRASREYRKQGVSTDLVLKDKRREVKDMYWKEAGRLKAWSVNHGSSSGARSAGVARGDRARLHGASGAISS